MFEVEIEIAYGDIAQIIVTKTETGEKRVQHIRAFFNNVEEYSKQVAQDMVDDWKRKDREPERRTIKYTLD